MEKTGIIGGIGPESTVDYYKGIIKGFRQERTDDKYPEIILNSIDMTVMLTYVANKDYVSLIDQLSSAIINLRDGGANFAVIASNTPHVVFDKVKEKSPIPLISIVDATARKARELKLKNLLLIGTGFTMKNTFYQDNISQYGIAVNIPSEEDQEIIHKIIFPELEEGIVIAEKKEQMIQICNKYIERDKIDGVILGCTELPLMIQKNNLPVVALNTTQNHVDAVVKRLCRI